MHWGVIIGNKVTLSHGVTILSVGLDTTSYAENAEKKYRDHIRKMSLLEMEHGLRLM